MRDFFAIILASVCLSTTASNTPRNNFEIILQVDPSLTSVPQKVYLHILTESEHSILDSALIDDRHKMITLSGRVP